MAKLHEWEKVHDAVRVEVSRMEVPGGWIYSIVVLGERVMAEPHTHAIFVPFPAPEVRQADELPPLPSI